MSGIRRNVINYSLSLLPGEDVYGRRPEAGVPASLTNQSTLILDGVKSGLSAEVIKLLGRPLKANEQKAIEVVMRQARPGGEPVAWDDHTGFIFGVHAAFGLKVNTPHGDEYEPGLGLLLPKFAKAGMKIAVITTNAKQRELVNDLNRNIPDGKKIKAVDNLAEAKNALSTARFNYFMVNGDAAVSDDDSITVYNITTLVKRIIEALGHEFKLASEELARLQEAAIKLAQAA